MLLNSCVPKRTKATREVLVYGKGVTVNRARKEQNMHMHRCPCATQMAEIQQLTPPNTEYGVW